MRVVASQNRSGHFTLAELIVVVIVIGLALALLLPVVNSARESTRRQHCISNMKQITSALSSYESAQGAFPPAVPTGTSKAWHSTGV